MATIPPVAPVSVPTIQRGEGAGNAVTTPGGEASSSARAASLAQAALDPLTAALQEALAAAAPRQGGLARAFAELQSLSARSDLPPQVAAAARALLALRLDGAAVTPAAVAAALRQSGLYLEAQLAARQSPAADIKLALLKLDAVLRDWLRDTPARPNESPPAPPPPYRGASPAGQPVASAQGATAAIPDAAQLARVAIEAALARHTMLQAASLPAPEQSAARPGEAHRLVFDIPLQVPQGTAVVQLRIERDAPRKDGGDAAAPVWRLAFSVDTEPTGPVHARIAQTGARTHVALTAERPASAQALRGNLGELRAMLAAAALEPGDLVCNAGAPEAAAAAPGLFVNRAT